MNTVLYYPFLHPSPAWLRVAALCWDKVYRIRPSDAPDDPDEIATLNSVCHNILESITPGDAGGLPPGNYARSLDEVRAAVRLKLERWVTDNLEDLRHQQPSPEDGRAIADHVGLLASKFPDVEVLSLLHRHGLARSRVVSVEGTETDWL